MGAQLSDLSKQTLVKRAEKVRVPPITSNAAPDTKVREGLDPLT
jgi:hypothetical protein